MKKYLVTYWIAYCTIARKEIVRFTRIWLQTLLPPAISMFLYFLIFGSLIGQRIGTMGGFSYMEYIAPGIIMMSIINSAFANVVSSFFGAKFQRHIEETLVAPVPNMVIIAGFVTGGIVRALLVAAIVTAIALLFTPLRIHSLPIMVIVIFLAALAFSLGGLINGIFAKKFDDVTVVPTFLLSPLIYLGGVFYSIELLPEFWQKMSIFNPILYIVNAFRYGMIGQSDIAVTHALFLLVVLVIILAVICMYLLQRGTGIKT